MGFIFLIARYESGLRVTNPRYRSSTTHRAIRLHEQTCTTKVDKPSTLVKHIKISGDIFAVFIGHPHFRHRGVPLNFMRCLNPMAEVFGYIRRPLRRYRPVKQKRSAAAHFPIRFFNIWNRVAGAATIKQDLVLSSMRMPVFCILVFFQTYVRHAKCIEQSWR
jgi:hypothetical protein